MGKINTERLLLRNFMAGDWPEVLNLAIDWKSAPGPEFDKLPTDEESCKGLTEYFSKEPSKYLAIELINTGKVIGLLALNGMTDTGSFDLGHIINSKYQDNDIDHEALGAAVAFIFCKTNANTIITNNADYDKQIAPLLSLGFHKYKQSNGELILTRSEWSKQSKNIEK